MEEEIRITYSHLAATKSYFLGVRTTNVKKFIVAALGGLAFLGPVVTVLLIVAWICVGLYVDAKQKKTKRDYVDSERTWFETKNLVIKDLPRGVLSIFSDEGSKPK